MSKENKPLNELDYEAGMKELETIIERLENSQLPLNEMMILYERGQELAKYCQELLDKAELKVTTLGQNPDDEDEEA